MIAIGMSPRSLSFLLNYHVHPIRVFAFCTFLQQTLKHEIVWLLLSLGGSRSTTNSSGPTTLAVLIDGLHTSCRCGHISLSNTVGATASRF